MGAFLAMAANHAGWLPDIYARFYDISIGHYTWFVVTCNELSLMLVPRRSAGSLNYGTVALHNSCIL
jgi:hypothetical protein